MAHQLSLVHLEPAGDARQTLDQRQGGPLHPQALQDRTHGRFTARSPRSRVLPASEHARPRVVITQGHAEARIYPRGLLTCLHPPFPPGANMLTFYLSMLPRTTRVTVAAAVLLKDTPAGQMWVDTRY